MKFQKQWLIFGIGAVLVFVLGAALGGMFVKIQYLEGKVSGVTAAAPSAAPTQPQQPEIPTKINIAISPTDPVLGDPNAKLTIIEFSDFQCPYCEQLYKNVEKQLIKEYVDTGKAKFVYKQLPLVGLHENALSAANASLCAKEQNKFWEYHDKLFEIQGTGSSDALSVSNLKKYAVDLRLDSSKFDNCFDNKKYDSQIQADIAEANKNGINGTPFTVVGTTPVNGAQPYAQFKAAIDAQLAAAK